MGSLRVGRSLPTALSSAASDVGLTGGGNDEGVLPKATALNDRGDVAADISPMTDRSATPSTYKKRVTINRAYNYGGNR